MSHFTHCIGHNTTGRGNDLIFDLAMVTLTYKILSRVYLGNCNVSKVYTWLGHWLEG